ncbi:hypothetical protein [Actinobacillus equuli]|uniref:hypothetical protein n=1 Tax=Actinobacillus equuli TaxID=718 RepID=UPI002441B02E|nr:hypothetical protein [Actinobacillus equuli]WGE47483.1 hypothetical protein NYR84_04625 [Actinobacillus equuli subsp. haemolyticus]
MKNIFLLILSFFTLSSVSAKDDFLFNPCTNERVSLEHALFNKNILLNKDVKINKGEFFLISYLDNGGDVCYEKKFDLLFKLNNVYLYSKELFDGLDDIFPDIGIENNMIVIDFEYGSGQSNIERYYFSVDSNNIYLNKKEIVYSREGKSKEIKYNKVDIKNVLFSRLVNND